MPIHGELYEKNNSFSHSFFKCCTLEFKVYIINLSCFQMLKDKSAKSFYIGDSLVLALIQQFLCTYVFIFFELPSDERTHYKYSEVIKDLTLYSNPFI